MQITVTRINRYAVKGFTEEVMAQVRLSAGKGLPGDREYALALPATDFDEKNPRPLPKTEFAVLMKYESLANIATEYEWDTSVLKLRHRDGRIVSGDLRTSEGRRAIERDIEEHLAGKISGGLRIVRADGHRFTDISVISPEMMEAVSLINLASVRDFEQKIDRKVDPRRFRANFLIDGLPPWQEFDLLGREIRIGDVRLRVESRTKRCAATEVNPDTAERDIRLPVELLKKYKHGDMGIYLTVLSDGIVRLGDSVVIS